MKKFTLPLLAAFAMLLGNVANGDIITSFGVAATEDFDTFEGTLATVPTDFTWSDGDYDPGGIYNGAGAYVNNNSTYALGFDPAGIPADRAFGSKSPTSGTDFLNWTITNGTGAAISTFSVSWDVEQYSQAGRPTTVDFNYNSNGGGFTQNGIVGTTLTAAITGADGNLSSVAVTNRSVTVNLGTALQDGQSILFGFGIFGGAGSAGSNAHIGVDNISVTAIPEPTSFALLNGVLVGIGLVRRRR